jgi:hypothetical protein
MSWHFVDDFDSKLLVRPDVLASPDRCISSLAKDLPCQMVKLLKFKTEQ